MALAERLGGVVVNADSMQVYRNLRILTARPTDDDLTRVPHRLFGHVDAAETFSVGRWLEDARAELSRTVSTGQVPIFVGGTGLYLRALVTGLSAIPAVPESLRVRLREEARHLTPADLHRMLAARDPVMADRLRPTDPQRLLRALEVLEATGRSLSEYQVAREAPLLDHTQVLGVVIMPPRPVLNQRIKDRFDAMIASDALGEVARLAERGLDSSLPIMRALGVMPLMAAIAGAASIDAAVADAKAATVRYAKRQITYARHQLGGFSWIDPEGATETVQRLWEEPHALI